MPEDRTIFRRTVSGDRNSASTVPVEVAVSVAGPLSTAADTARGGSLHCIAAMPGRTSRETAQQPLRQTPQQTLQQTRGFTLIDLIVSLAVMTILVTMMLPVLTGAYETARRFRCASNIRQIGLGMQMYADDYDDKLPASIFRAGSQPSDPHDTIFVRKTEDLDRSITRATWDGVGFLFKLQYLETPEVFYCPSHHGLHPYDRYADRWTTQPGDIVINYQYRITDNPFMSMLDPGTSLIADGMRTKLDYNHVDGNNTLKADLSMPWYEDVTRQLFLSLPDTDEVLLSPSEEGEARAGVQNAWNILDTQSGRAITGRE